VGRTREREGSSGADAERFRGLACLASVRREISAAGPAAETGRNHERSLDQRRRPVYLRRGRRGRDSGVRITWHWQAVRRLAIGALSPKVPRVRRRPALSCHASLSSGRLPPPHFPARFPALSRPASHVSTGHSEPLTFEPGWGFAARGRRISKPLRTRRPTLVLGSSVGIAGRALSRR
jgi:hypothetical protein